MNLLELKPQKATEELFKELEERQLIQRLHAPDSVYLENTEDDALETLYVSDPQYGGHKMIVVQKNATKITDLYYHPDKEEVIAINLTSKEFKPLYLIIGLLKAEEFEAKAASGSLTEEDVLAIEIPFNDPRFSYFTMLEGTPHCEITASGPGLGPVFFVTEPSDFVQFEVKKGDYQFFLK